MYPSMQPNEENIWRKRKKEEEEEEEAQKICEDWIDSGFQNVEDGVDLVHYNCLSLQHKKRFGTIIKGSLHLTFTHKQTLCREIL